jgi:hypothetical protein
MLEIRLGRSAQGRGNEQIKQAVARNSIAVTAHGLSRDDPTDKIVLDAVAGRTAIAKAPLDRVCIGRHQLEPRTLETFIANSTQGSQTSELA